MLLNEKVRSNEADTHGFEPATEPTRRQVLTTSQVEYNIGILPKQAFNRKIPKSSHAEPILEKL